MQLCISEETGRDCTALLQMLVKKPLNVPELLCTRHWKQGSTTNLPNQLPKFQFGSGAFSCSFNIPEAKKKIILFFLWSLFSCPIHPYSA